MITVQHANIYKISDYARHLKNLTEEDYEKVATHPSLGLVTLRLLGRLMPMIQFDMKLYTLTLLTQLLPNLVRYHQF